MKKLISIIFFLFLIGLPIGSAFTYINKDTGKELWFQDKIFRLFSVTAQECSALDGTTYTNYAGECRKRLNCKPSSDLSICGCDVSVCDSSSPPPTTTDPSVTTCSKSSGSIYINGQKTATDGCYSGISTRFECKPSPSISGYSLSFSGTYYDVLVDGACSVGTTSGSVTYTSVPTSVIKGNKFTIQANIKLDSIASSDCLQTIEGCRLLFELGAESCPSGNCLSQLKPQAIIPIFAEKSACDENPYWASTTTIVKSGDIVQATFMPLAPTLIGQYKYGVNVFRGCGDNKLPISSSQVNIEVKDGSAPSPETKFYCLSSDKKTCTSRLGSCLSGETSYTDGATCEANMEGGGGITCIPDGKYSLNPLDSITCCNSRQLIGLCYTPSINQSCAKEGENTILKSCCEGLIQDKTKDGLPCIPKCSKPAGASCDLLETSGIDETQASNECKSGICVDVAGSGGRCHSEDSYTLKSGIEITSHPDCVIEEEITKEGAFGKFVESIGKSLNDTFGGKSKTKLTDVQMGYTVLGIVAFFIMIAFTRK